MDSRYHARSTGRLSDGSLGLPIDRQWLGFTRAAVSTRGTWTSLLDLRDVVYEHLAADQLAVVGVLAKLPWPTEWRHVQLMRTLV